MPTVTHHVRVKRSELYARLRRLPRELVRRTDLSQAFRNHFAYHYFTRIAKAFRVKSKGGTDEFGITWPDLDRRTKAYRPLNKTEQRRTPPGTRGILSLQENRIWRGIFKSQYLRLIAQGKPEASAKVLAAKLAWSILKSQGAKTKLETYGNRRVDMLRVSDRLYSSVEPGTLSGNHYYPKKEQTVKYAGDELQLGSAVPYADKQEKKRPIFPAKTRTIRSGVYSQIAKQAVMSLFKTILTRLKR